MPWQEMSPVDLRLQFISEYLSKRFGMTELATQYQISRKTAYKWVGRYETGGPAALVDRSRRPHAQPSATDVAVVEALMSLRRATGTGGPRSCCAGTPAAAAGGMAESIHRL